MITLTVEKKSVYNDCAEIVDIFGQGCNYPTKKGVEGFQVEFEIIIKKENEERKFVIVFQSEDRSDNMMAFNGYEMSTAARFGCDADESGDAVEFADWNGTWLEELQESAEAECKAWLKRQ